MSDDHLAAKVAPRLDAVIEAFTVVPNALWRVLWPLRPAVDLYLNALNLEQRWSMFANPPTFDQYLRVRYFIAQESGASAQPVWMATELVLPAHREDSVRGLQSFFDSSRDKALAIALDDFQRNFALQVDRTGRLPDPLPDDLAPVGRYFARRFEPHLRPHERIVRVETWYAEIENRARGRAPGSAAQVRAAVLRSYYGGPIRTPVTRHFPLQFGAKEVEADLTWKLLYAE